MHKIMIFRVLRIPAALCLVVAAGCGGDASRSLGPQTADADGPLAVGSVATSPRVLPPNAHPHGRSYGEWAAAWWQYVLSVPVDQNPLFDETGANCAVSQTGHVFFLVGVFNETGTAVRSECVIPTGVMLFFPIVNTICTNHPPPLTPTEQLRPCAAEPIDAATGLAVEIDGVPVGDLESFRAQSPLFGLTLPEDNLLGTQAGTCNPDPAAGGVCVPYLAVADGFYLMLPPLPPGEHIIHIHGVLPPFVPGEESFTVDITYDPLTVVPRGGVS